MSEKKVIIIGAGISGLCAGNYLQMNNYNTEIFELHDKCGGLCTECPFCVQSWPVPERIGSCSVFWIFLTPVFLHLVFRHPYFCVQMGSDLFEFTNVASGSCCELFN